MNDTAISAWLRDHSSGSYRDAAAAAGRLDRLHSAMARMALNIYGDTAPNIVAASALSDVFEMNDEALCAWLRSVGHHPYETCVAAADRIEVLVSAAKRIAHPVDGDLCAQVIAGDVLAVSNI